MEGTHWRNLSGITGILQTKVPRHSEIMNERKIIHVAPVAAGLRGRPWSVAPAPSAPLPQPPRARARRSLPAPRAVLRRGAEVLGQYLRTSSLHGTRYIADPDAHWIERVLWAVFVGLGMFGSCWLIGQVWLKYRTSPTITSVEETNYPIWNIPFPAVTICNVNKVVYSSALKLYQEYEISKDVGLEEYMMFVKQLSDMIEPQDFEKADKSGMEVLREKHNLTIAQMMQKLAQPCESLLVACRWRGEMKRCKRIFRQQLSDAGFCCSFNYHAFDTGISEPVWYVNGAGYLTGLSVLLDLQLDEYYSWPFSFRGLQVLVHLPYNYPDVSARGVVIGSRQECFLQVSAESTYTSDNLRFLPPQQRKCLFNNENNYNRSLGGNYYTFRNCMVLCRLQYMLKLCECIPFNYPNFNAARTCGLLDIECLSKHKAIFNNVQVDGDDVPGLNRSEGISCECSPSCEDIAYRTDLSQHSFFHAEHFSKFFPGKKIENRTILHIYFKDLYSIRFRRDIIFTWNDLLASFGGIVGLFLGCSLLSMVEFVYFFSLRLMLQKQPQNSKNPALANERLSNIFTWTP